jgi:phosphoribosyl 1,2-cyclic phosphate phosphodiesterase
LSKIKVTLLGTGGSAGSPQIGGADGGGEWGELNPGEPRNRRSRPSIVIEGPDGRRLLVDTGPDLRLQLTACKIPKIDAILYTHAHADHIAGLDEVRILNRLIGVPMPAYAMAASWAELQDRLPVRLIGQDHGFVTSLGVRIGGFAYCTDVVRLDAAALEQLEHLEVFVIDCFTRFDPHPTHANLEQVLAWVARLQPKRTILTHMGPSMDYAWLLANLPQGVEPGYDGQSVDAEYP